MRKVLCEWNQEEIDELATETCECVNARIAGISNKGNSAAEAAGKRGNAD